MQLVSQTLSDFVRTTAKKKVKVEPGALRALRARLGGKVGVRTFWGYSYYSYYSYGVLLLLLDRGGHGTWSLSSYQNHRQRRHTTGSAHTISAFGFPRKMIGPSPTFLQNSGFTG